MTSQSITNAIAVADWTYKAAGVDAIFPGSPSERRFRDIHTFVAADPVARRLYESVGQVLLGNDQRCFYKV